MPKRRAICRCTPCLIKNPEGCSYSDPGHRVRTFKEIAQELQENIQKIRSRPVEAIPAVQDSMMTDTGENLRFDDLPDDNSSFWNFTIEDLADEDLADEDLADEDLADEDWSDDIKRAKLKIRNAIQRKSKELADLQRQLALLEQI